MLAGIDDQDAELDESRDDGRDRGADCTELRKTEVSVDQKEVADEVDEDRADGCDHRDFRAAKVLKRSGVGLRQSDRNQADEDDLHVIDTDLQGLGGVGRIALALKEQLDQKWRTEGEDQNADRSEDRVEDDLETEGVTDAFCVAFAVILCGEDADAGGRTEDQQVEDEDQLVCDGNAGKCICADLADHEVVEQVDEIRNCILHHHRDGDHHQSLNILSFSRLFIFH